MSIEQNGAEVENDDAQIINKHDNVTDTKANDKGTSNKGVIVTSSKAGKLIQAKELKQLISFRALLEADGHKVQQSGQYVKCCCPFHPDRTPSFFVNEADDYARCYGCDWHGNIYDYEEKWHHVDFTTAWLRLNDFCYNCLRAGRKAKNIIKKVMLDVPQFTSKQLEERKHYAERLATEKWLAELVCQRRFEATGEGWKPETIQQLAKDGFLGWADCLAFIYPRGTKYRNWPGREFYWEYDGSSLWRGELLAKARHVYLTESETDTIAMVDTGVEKEHEHSAIIAVSGAGNFQASWAPLFKGKVVTLCFDNDKPGIDGANKTGLLLKPYVSELFIHELGGAI